MNFKLVSDYQLELSANPKQGATLARRDIMARLTDLQYERSEFDFRRGTFRVHGDVIDIYPSHEDFGIRVEMNTNGTLIDRLIKVDPLTGKKIENLERFVVYPAKHYMTDPQKYKDVSKQIRQDTQTSVTELKAQNKGLEAQRLQQRVNYNYVNGIENYSRYFDGRAPGDPPYSLP